MKKFILIFTVLALLAVLVGCDSAQVKNHLNDAEERVEDALDKAEDAWDKAEDHVEDAWDKAEDAWDKVEDHVEGALNAESELTMEEAENIAFKAAGVKREQTQNLHTEYGHENGMPKYEIEFRTEDWEYEFEIHAENGNVISSEKEPVWG